MSAAPAPAPSTPSTADIDPSLLKGHKVIENLKAKVEKLTEQNNELKKANSELKSNGSRIKRIPKAKGDKAVKDEAANATPAATPVANSLV